MAKRYSVPAPMPSNANVVGRLDQLGRQPRAAAVEHAGRKGQFIPDAPRFFFAGGDASVTGSQASARLPDRGDSETFREPPGGPLPSQSGTESLYPLFSNRGIMMSVIVIPPFQTIGAPPCHVR